MRGVGNYADPIALTYSAPAGLTVSGPSSVIPGSAFTTNIALSQGSSTSQYYPITITATDSRGLTANLALSTFSTTQPGQYCPGSSSINPNIFNFNNGLALTADPRTTGQIAGSLTAGVNPAPTAGWVTSISNASMVYWGPGPLWGKTLGTSSGTVTSGVDQSVTMQVPSAAIQYPGYGWYYFYATYTFTNPGCAIVLPLFDPGVVSTDGHTVTYTDWWIAYQGSDYPPFITSVTPSTLYGGTVAAVTIEGENFGGSPTVTIGNTGDPNQITVAAGTPTIDVAGLQTVTVNITVPAAWDGTTQNVVIQSNGEYGDGFQFIPQSFLQQPVTKSNPAQVSIAGQVTLSVTANGADVAPNSTQLISATPSFPALVASLVPPVGQSLSGNVQWSFSAVYESPPYLGNSVVYTCTAPGNGQGTGVRMRVFAYQQVRETAKSFSLPTKTFTIGSMTRSSSRRTAPQAWESQLNWHEGRELHKPIGPFYPTIPGADTKQNVLGGDLR